ncbi:hypothetical protein N7539_008339 [Penicillium diatomitis]|uniref:Uncharacterized protein n=1 Tax=Penicillium diatomitis TaxID=2819901 RepID=A0A9X0BNE0_9EURO|nr:uncharacterized protein N7539_008339 [Penicillium diatomitis]KAJ5475273.1 hypothetical protein N7539_008339 [Penicillium diatomitis]
MTYLIDSYQRFLASPRNAPLATNATLIYVPVTTKVEGADAIATHTSRQSHIVKKTSDKVMNAIESSDALCLDMETTLHFVEGGGVYLPSLDDNFLVNRVVTFPTIHIVQFNAEQQIQQVRIYWDQGSLLKEVEVIGARGRVWPIRPAQDQVRLLKTAIAEKSTPTLTSTTENKTDLPTRPASPGKRYIKDPYAADSLFDLLSPIKDDPTAGQLHEASQSKSSSKRYTRDPYAAESLTELLSPSKQEEARRHPYAQAAGRPRAHDYNELFVGDDDEMPSTPSKAEKTAEPRVGSKFQRNRIFGNEEEHDAKDARAPYKTDPKKFNHFEIGGDNAEFELKQQPQRSNHSRQQSQTDANDFSTPQKSTRVTKTEDARGFGYAESEADLQTPVFRQAVHKPRRDADIHFDLTDDNEDEENERPTSSYENRGKGLYENRLFDDEGTPKADEVLGVTGNKASRLSHLESHWEPTDESPVSNKTKDDGQKPIPLDRARAVQMMESSWDKYDQSPEPIRNATALHNPSRHNQPSWTIGDD